MKIKDSWFFFSFGLLIVSLILLVLCMMAFFGVLHPRLVVLPSSDINFGTIGKGQNVRKTIFIKNGGLAPLKIFSLASSCNCTVGSVNNDFLWPWQSTSLTIETGSKSLGTLKESVLVKSNSEDNKELLLKITAIVASEIYSLPDSMNLGVIMSDELSRTYSFIVASNNDLSINDYSLVPTADYLQVLGQTKLTNRSFEVKFKIGSSAPSGEWQENIVCSNKSRERLRIPVSARLISKLRITPTILVFNSLKAGVFSNNIEIPSNMKALVSLSPSLLTDFITVDGQDSSLMRLRLKKDCRPNDINGYLIINFRGTELKRHSIPIIFSNVNF